MFPIVRPEAEERKVPGADLGVGCQEGRVHGPCVILCLPASFRLLGVVRHCVLEVGRVAVPPGALDVEDGLNTSRKVVDNAGTVHDNFVVALETLRSVFDPKADPWKDLAFSGEEVQEAVRAEELLCTPGTHAGPRPVNATRGPGALIVRVGLSAPVWVG